MARSAGVEPATAWFVARYSIQLSYERVRPRNILNRGVGVKLKLRWVVDIGRIRTLEVLKAIEAKVEKIGLFFGSDDGNTESVARRIAQRLGADKVDIHDVRDVNQVEFLGYDKLILAIPTWDFGQIQSDWEEFWSDLEALDFSGKTVAMVGLGDQFGYGDFFLDAMGMLHDVVIKTADKIIGYWSTQGYEYDTSKAELPGGELFAGLALDEDQQPELTDDRLDQWCEQVRSEFGLITAMAG